MIIYIWQEWRERYAQSDEIAARNRMSMSEMKETNYGETLNSNTDRRMFNAQSDMCPVVFL